jgi:predicted nuclease of predicted toxin-antitoxin system
VKFLIDAQLPWRLAHWLNEHRYDARHTLELPLGNRTPDHEVVACAIREERIIVTKDSDFVQTFLLTGQPRLLFVATGNIGNPELESLLRRNLSAIEAAFTNFRFIEITRTDLIIHE